MKGKPKPLSFEYRALAAAEKRQAQGKRIVFGVDEDEDVELSPDQVHKLQKHD